MATLSEIFSHLHTITSVFFALLFLELVILVRSVTGGACTPSSTRRQITPAQFQDIVEQNFPTARFKAGRRWRSPDCAVCLSEFNEGERVRVLPCKHVFHRECLDRWLERGWTTCPLCRNRVLPENIAAGLRRGEGEVEYDGSDEEFMFLLSALHGNSLHRYL